MGSRDAILIALVTVLALLAVYHFGPWKAADGFAPGGTTSSGVATHQPYPCGVYNPYTVLNKGLDAIRGYRSDGHGQPPFYRHPHGLDTYHRAGAHLTPEDIAEAERGQWYAATEESCTGGHNAEHFTEPTADTMQYHTGEPPIDYSSYITDLIVDPRTKDNHRRWVEEMKPWSGTAMKVDDLNVEDYLDFTGLRRPQAVVQYNPMMLTEVDAGDLSHNRRFNFQG